MKILEINNKHYQECDVVMLPCLTQVENTLCFIGNVFRFQEGLITPGGNIKPQHLYILSNEEIKKGVDYYYDSHHDLILKSSSNSDHKIYGYKKVIGTTDKLNTHPNTADSYRTGNCVPQILQQFIEYYITEFNKGNQISKVMVEIVDNGGYRQDSTNGCWISKWEIKLNEKNEISILTSEVVEERIFNASVMKRETLEEAAQSYLHKVADGKRPTGYADEDFINGAKWQTEQKPTYTEKEIKDFLELLHFHGYINHDITKLNDLIEYLKQ